MNTLSRYISKLFIRLFLVISLAMVVLLGVLDALSNAELLPQGATFSDNLRYMALRLPVLFDRTIGFALLLGVMLTFMMLIRRNELVPVWGAGLSVFGQIRALVPVLALSGLAAAVIADQTIPPAQRALENWLGPKILQDDTQIPEALWLSEKDRFVEIEQVGEDSLTGLTLYERSKAGRIASVSRAKSGRLAEKGWELSGVSQVRYDGGDPQPPTLWTTPLKASTLRELMSEPRNLSIRSLYELAHLERSGNRPSSAYWVWMYSRLTLPVVAVGFLLLALPLMQRFGRHDHTELTLVIGMIFGFVYLITDGVFKSLAESGVLNAAMATAIPIIGLYVVGLSLAWYRARRI